MKQPNLLALGDLGTDSCGGKKGRNSGSCGPTAFCEGSLRYQFYLELAREHLAFELVVLAHIGTNHFANLPRLQEKSEAKTVDAGVVGDAGKVAAPAQPEGRNEVLGDATEAKTTNHKRHAVCESVEG